MENVQGLASDPAYAKGLRRLRKRGYTVESTVIKYADWGAATARHRLFTFGFQDPTTMATFMESMMARQKPARSVMSAIERFAGVAKQGFPDHVWPELRTIGRYKSKYRTSKFGWYQPAPDRPAPSFGNVAKTYILHPRAGLEGFALRVISVREAMAIMGFTGAFRFPRGFAMRTRYQMVADAVSPVYSRVVARAIRDALE
jgi:DNA (cytosine-5)-methyltransferase 1